MTTPEKRAYLVLGAESHGTHLVTNILINAGCIGHAGGQTQWYTDLREIPEEAPKPWEHDLPVDIQPWDKATPTHQNPVVWRRSMPHGGRWVDIGEMVTTLRRSNYSTLAVVVTRERGAAILSQLKWRHVDSDEQARNNIEKAYRHIYRYIEENDMPHILVSYEALTAHPDAQRSLIREIGLAPPATPYPVRDGNRKWYEH